MTQGIATSKTGREGPASKVEPIYRWLGLPLCAWPPNHYVLLGLPAGADDSTLIENAVQDRITRVRVYQLANPELATIALNRLAEAYACLTDPQSKHRYDADRGFEPLRQAQRDTKADSHVSQANAAETSTIPQIKAEDAPNGDPPPTVVAYTQGQPPPVRAAVPDAGETVQPNANESSVNAAPMSERQASPANARRKQKFDPILEIARGSRPAVTGLGSRKRIYQRICRTRQLLRYWRHLGRYLKQPDGQLADRTGARDMRLCLKYVEKSLERFPKFFGRAGKPGYRVSILAQDESPIKEFQRMNLGEREMLSLEWSTGFVVLHTHLQYLRRELKKRRNDSAVTKLLRPWGVIFSPRNIVGLVLLAVVFVIGVELFLR